MGDYILRLGKRRSAQLSYIRDCPMGKDILFEVADKFFQIFLKASAMDGLMPLNIMVRTLFFHSRECGVVLN